MLIWSKTILQRALMKSYPEIAAEISTELKKVREGIPDVSQAFSGLAKAAMKKGVLDSKTKELIAFAIGVASRCDGCLAFHAKALVELGASREEVLETLGVAVYMGGGPSLMYAAYGIQAFDEFLSGQA
jgi:AhpD family alkylhydroperoxidase